MKSQPSRTAAEVFGGSEITKLSNKRSTLEREVFMVDWGLVLPSIAVDV